MASSRLLLGSLNPDQVFEQYELREDNEQNRTLVEGLARLADNFVRDAEIISSIDRPFNGRPHGIFITGGPGRGKTHLLNAMFNRMLTGAPGLAGSAALVRDSAQNTDSYAAIRRLEQNGLTRAKIVGMDDLGARTAISVGARIQDLPELIQDAYDTGRFLIITSNLGIGRVIAALEEGDPSGRSASRFAEMFPTAACFEAAGLDFRLERGQQVADPFGYA